MLQISWHCREGDNPTKATRNCLSIYDIYDATNP